MNDRVLLKVALRRALPRGTINNRSTLGFTLLELMVVLLILALLGSIAAPRVAKYLGRAKAQTAQIQVDALGAAVESFLIDNGRYPTSQEGLAVLMQSPAGLATWDGPYLQKAGSLVDPWSRPYRYQYPGQRGIFDLYSYGSDGEAGGSGDARDVGNW